MLTILLSASIICPADGRAKPAVSEFNIGWVASYDFEHTEEDETLGFPFFVFLPEVERHFASTALRATAPMGERFGVRAHLGASYVRSEFNGTPFPAPDADGFEIGTGVDVFLRDPDHGRLGVGYRYAYAEPDVDRDGDRELHLGVLDAGLFLPDIGFGPIDLEVMGGIGRTDQPSTLLDDGEDRIYSIVGTARIYPAPRLQIEAGASWARSDGDTFESDDIRGRLRVLWLPPLGRPSILTAGLRATAGEVQTSSELSISDFEQFVYSIGVEFSLLWPGSNSLVELARERE